MQSQIHTLHPVANDSQNNASESASGHHLEAAYSFFHETSAQLADSYRMLEQRVQQLSRELEEATQEKAKAKKQTGQLNSRMQALLDFLPGGVIVLDQKGMIVEANPAAVSLLDYPLKGKLWRKVIGECFAPKNDDGLEVSTRNGKRISISTSSMDNDGQIILLTDQTETRKLQENLSRHERLSALGKMVSALAHQIRTPLSAAMLYAGHLKQGELDPAKRELFSHKLYGRLQHMEKQVRDMMLFVKHELPLNDEVSLADLESGCREAAEVAIATANCHCEWNNTFPERKIKCHRDALISAMMNLVNNAIQACDEEPQLSISFDVVEKDQQSYAVIQVVDNGQGMNESELAQAQELFVTSKPQGTGLGLSVVNSVVRAHGGAFHLLSHPGQGSAAIVEIPLTETSVR